MKRFVAGLGLGLALGAGGAIAVGVIATPESERRVANDDPEPVTTPSPTRSETPPPTSVAPPAAVAPPKVRVRQPVRPPREPGTGPAGKKPAKNADNGDEDLDPFARWGADDFLQELIRLGSDAGTYEPDDVANTLRERFPDVQVPFETVLALLRPLDGGWGEKTYGATQSIQTWDAKLARRALDLAVDETGEEGALLRRIVSRLAERVAQTGGGDGPLYAKLAGSADETLRMAAVDIGAELDPQPTTDLIRLATTDDDESVRAYALETVVAAAIHEEEPAAIARITPLVILAAREGSPHLRHSAIELLPELGPEAAGVALLILQEDGLEESLYYSLIETVNRAGRMAEFLTSEPPREQVVQAAWIVAETELDDDALERLRPHIGTLLEALGPDEAESLIWALAVPGNVELLEDIARGAEYSTEARATALWAVHESEANDAGERSLALAAEILRDPRRYPASLRRRVVTTYSEFLEADWDGEEIPAGVSVLQAVVRSDPSYWVRAAAAEVLEYWEE